MFEIPKCRSCKSNKWTCSVIETFLLDGDKFVQRPGEVREFRCTDCNLKSIQEQEPLLEAILLSPEDVAVTP